MLQLPFYIEDMYMLWVTVHIQAIDCFLGLETILQSA